jgi:NTE family protein
MTAIPTSPKVGLVLGAGGTVGAAYHAGALAALQHDLDWDARDAAVVVGTSAGSIVGSLLRLGVPPTDLAALTVGAPTRQTIPELAASLLERPVFPPVTLRHLMRIPRLPTPSMMVGLAQRTMKIRNVSPGALSMLLPEGRERLIPHLEFLDALVGPTWSAASLRICAVRRKNWHRHVFDPATGEAPLSAMIGASCAVPGYFAGVRINGDTYLDGGVVSATNADVLVKHGIDLAIVVSPMTGHASWLSPLGLMRRQCRVTLDRELRSLERHGIPSVVIEPGAEVLAHMSTDFMSDAASTEIVRASFLDSGTQIASAPALRALHSRASAQRTG